MAQKLKDQPTSDGESGDNRRSIWEWLTPFLAHLAQMLSLAGLIGFISAIALNSLLFRLWGLSFLQLASTSDVILSGLQLAFLLLVPMAGGAFGWWVIGRARLKWSSDLARGAMMVVVIVALAGWAFLNISGWISGDTTFYVAVLSFLMIAAARTSANPEDWLRRPSPRDRVVLGVWFALLIFQGVLPAVGQFSLIVREGMVGARLVAPAVDGCPTPAVMWIGERSIVVRCLTGEMRVLYQVENIQLMPVRSPTRRSTGADDLFRHIFGLPQPSWPFQ